MVTLARGQVIGRAAASVAHAHFGDRGKVGATGELRTARLLDELANRPGGPTVLHDLRIPIPGFRANLDHAVVSGREVTLVDSKVWKAGLYWTLGGKTFRDLERAEHADRKTLTAGRDGIARFLRDYGVTGVTFRPSVIVAWPGSSSAQARPANFLLYRPSGSVAIAARDDASTLRRLSRRVGKHPADQQLVAALSKLLYA